MSSVHPALACVLHLSRFASYASVLLLSVACGPDTPPQPALRLLDVRPRERTSVYLNEPIVMHFSGELDRASVTALSVRITTLAGRPASGTRFVVGRELIFVPDPVLAPNLLDGGYLPNSTYVIELAGFPRVDGLRTVDGGCLANTQRVEFRTVQIESPRGGPLFIDDSPDHGMPLLISSKYAGGPPNRPRMSAQSGLELEGEEPIDPSTLSDDDFALVIDDGPGNRREYPLRALLTENHNKRAFHRQGTTRLRLLPGTLVPPGDYRLRINFASLHLRDLSGHPIPVIGREQLKQLQIRVMHQPPEGIRGEHLEEFLKIEKRSSVLVSGADGTALWSSTGRVEVRFPASAGDGSQGDVRFTATEQRARLSAARLSVPLEVATVLDGGSGLCVLASQGAIEIAGKLRREGQVQIAPMPEMRVGDTLSDWIQKQTHTTLPLTVIVAGGDLRISGELDVPGPLLLVAGGRIRVSGRIRVAGAEPVGASYLSDRGEDGAIAMWSARAGERIEAKLADAPLTLDPPRLNPLVRPLTYAVVSKPIPSEGRVSRWLFAEEPRGRAGAGSLRVGYIGERLSADASGSFEDEVEDPALLVDCPTLRLVLRLEVPVEPNAPWDPPTIDAVRVRWETQ